MRILPLLALILLSGCAAWFGEWSEESVVGDTFAECCRKENGDPIIRTGSDLDGEVWCTWGRGFATIGFDEAEWNAWKAVSVGEGQRISINMETGATVLYGADGKPVDRKEPRAKWVRYNFRCLIGEPSARF